MDLTIDNVAVSFGSVQALRGVSMELEAGKVSVLVGPNGAGKSTLMSIILGLLKVDSGRLLVGGHVVADAKVQSTTWLRERMGYLPEAASFSNTLSGREVLRFFALARGVKSESIDATLERVGLAHAARRRVGGYSRGMRQRLGLAVAILHEPPLLILDEPTGGLDQHGLTVLWRVLKEWKEAERTVLLSTHELALIERRADVMYVMSNGSLRASGTPDELRDQAGLPEEWRKGPGLDEVYEHLIRSTSSDA